MNYYTKKALENAIQSATKLIELNFKESSIVISLFGGRPLGFFPKNGCISLLWINPKIRETIHANDRAIGGDRYWISPERDYFYTNPEKWEGWFCPPTLDPANYELIGSKEDSCTVSSEISVENETLKKRFHGEITRQFKLVKEPHSTGLNYCGLEYLDDCVFFSSGLKMNGWSLACIISGGVQYPGTVLVPTKMNPKPLSYFREIPKDRLTVGENYVSYKIDVNDIYKLAIRPEDINYECPAKIGYCVKMPEKEEYGFLVKLSDDVPKTQTECFDIARDHPNSEIGVIQSYNSESPNKPQLNYGEIELQLKPFMSVDNTSHCKAKHQLFGYIGTKDEILTVIEKYLGVSDPYLF